MVRYNLARGLLATFPSKVRALNVGNVSSASKVLHPESMVWVIVGERAKIEAGIRELNLGEVRYLDADGNLLR